MASNQTSYYQLSQWLPEDAVLRTDFNGDNAKIDAALRQLTAGKADKAALDSHISQMGQALGAKADIVAGTYIGDGGESRFIPLIATPRAVLVMTQNGQTHGTGSLNIFYGGLAVTGSPATTAGVNNTNYPVVKIETGGFSVSCKENSQAFVSVRSNTADQKYQYLALI